MTTHGEVLRDAGIGIVRVDVQDPVEDEGRSFKRVKALAGVGIRVMAIIKSHRMIPTRRGWERKWTEYVEDLVSRLGPDVDFWQIDNELNHFYHSTLPFFWPPLRAEIIRGGCQAVKDKSPGAKTVVNLYSYGGFGRLGPCFLGQLVSLVEAGVPIDILGVDIYRGTYAFGGPSLYPRDLLWAHHHWNGDVLMTETGLSAPGLFRKEEAQSRYLVKVFEALHDDQFLRENPWFLGTLIYVYGCDRESINPEYHFGMLHPDGSPKPAWSIVVREAQRLRNSQSRLLFGVTSHVNEYDAGDVCPQ